MDEYAGFGRRFLAFIVDTLLFSVIAGFISFLFLGNESINVVPVNANNELNFQIFSVSSWLEQGIVTAVTLFMWVKFLGTPGKLILGCRVVDVKTHQAINLGQAVLRYISYFVSVIPMGLGFFWIIWDKRKQGFHDKIAGTVVLLETASSHADYLDKDDESQKSLQQLMAELR